MADKPIIDIPINDDAFKAFLELFDKYKEALAELPKDWEAVGKESAGAFDAVAAALLTQNELLRRSLQSTRDVARVSRGTEISWASISKHTKAAASNIIGAAQALVKWSGVATAVSGLLGAGGLYGIDRLAASVTSGRRTAAGLGVTYGQQQAFGLNFGRYVDPSAVLGNVTTGLFDVTSPQYVALLRAGVSPQMLARGNSADIGSELLRKIPGLFGGVPANQRGTLADVYGYSQLGIGVEDINRYLNASPAERERQQEAYRRDASGLNLTTDQQRAWNDLATQLTRAAKQIENTFVTALGPLIPQLEKLSAAVSESIKILLGSDGFRRLMDDIAAGLKEFASYIGSPNFRDDVRTFATDIEIIARKTAAALKWLGIIPDSAPAGASGGDEKTGKDITTGGGVSNYSASRSFALLGGGLGAAYAGLPGAAIGAGIGAGLGKSIDATGKAITDVPGPVVDPGIGYVPDYSGAAPKKPKITDVPGPAVDRGTAYDPDYSGNIHKEAFRTFEGDYGLPRGLLWKLEDTESSHRADAVSKRGALGSFQFMPETAQQYGVDDPFNRLQSAQGAARYLRHLVDEFKGDLAKAVAAYNWGEGNVARDVATHGRSWREHLPAETQREVDRVVGPTAPIRNMTPKPRPLIEIRNNTGGSAVIVASQLAV